MACVMMAQPVAIAEAITLSIKYRIWQCHLLQIRFDGTCDLDVYVANPNSNRSAMWMQEARLAMQDPPTARLSAPGTARPNQPHTGASAHNTPVQSTADSGEQPSMTPMAGGKDTGLGCEAERIRCAADQLARLDLHRQPRYTCQLHAYEICLHNNLFLAALALHILKAQYPPAGCKPSRLHLHIVILPMMNMEPQPRQSRRAPLQVTPNNP